MATVEQYNNLVLGLQTLAGVCDFASSLDNKGFNGADADFGHSLANRSLGTGVLTEKQQAFAVKMIQKYRNQLRGHGVEIPTVEEYGEAYGGIGRVGIEVAQSKFNVSGEKSTAVKEAEVVIELVDGRITVRINKTSSRGRFDELKDRIKSLPVSKRKFDFETLRWYVDPSLAQEVIERFSAEGFIHPAVRDLVTKVDQVNVKEELQSGTGIDVNKATFRIVKDRIIFRTPRYTPEWHALSMAIMGGKWNAKDRVWEYPTTSAADIVRKTEGNATVDLGEGIAAAAESMVKREELSRKHDGELEDNLPIPAGLVPFPYQNAGYNFMKNAEFRAILADDMGLGKTIQAILVMIAVREEGPILVSCPASVKLNWKREVEKWIPGVKVEVLNGRESQPLTRGSVDVYVINHDILGYGNGEQDGKKKKIVGWFEEFVKMGLSLAVFDEGHKIGNEKTIRGRAAREIAKVTNRTLILTGTPVQNRPRELFPLLNLVDAKSWPNFFAFAKRYCGAVHNGFGWDFSGSSNLDELHERIKPWVLRRTKLQVLKELPGKRRVDVILEMGSKERAAYDNAVTRWEKRIVNGQMGKGDHLVMMGELKQLAAQAKLAGSISWILDFVENGEKLIVFAVHKKVIQSVEEALTKAKVKFVTITGETSGKNRQAAVDAFQNDPSVQVFIGNIQAAGEGITLTAATDEVFLEFGWKPGEHAQAEDRANRIGQDSLVTCWYMVAEKTIDERLFGIIDGKRKVVETIMEGSTGDHVSEVVRMKTATGEIAEVSGSLVEALADKYFA